MAEGKWWIEDFEPRLQRLLEEEKSTQGRLISRRHGVVVHARKVGGTETEMIRAVGTVEGISAKELLKALWDVDRRQKWDTGNYVEWKVVKKLDEDTDLHYMRLKGMFGMAERDFADVRRKIELPDGSYAIMFRSIDHPELATREPAVRAETIFGGHLLTPVGPNSCRMTVCNQTDIKGSIPSYLVNKAAARAPADWFNVVRANARRLAQEYHEDSGGYEEAVSDAVATPMSPHQDHKDTSSAENQLEHRRLVSDLERRLRRCDRTQLVTLLQSLATSQAALLPVVAAGVAASAARRAEMEELVGTMVDLCEALQENSAERLMTRDGHKHLLCQELIEESNAKMSEILKTGKAALQGDNGAETTRFALLPVLELNAEMQIQVNNYMEAIHLQALAKAHAIDSDIAVEECASPRPGLMGRLSSWWLGGSPDTSKPPAPSWAPPRDGVYDQQDATLRSKRPAPEVEQYVDGGLDVGGLHSLQSVALRLNEKLELTSVKKLMRLNKYRSFSPEELTDVSNGHIVSVLEQVKRVRENLGDWTLGQQVFQIVENSAELCLKLNDYAEAVNQDTHRKMQTKLKS